MTWYQGALVSQARRGLAALNAKHKDAEKRRSDKLAEIDALISQIASERAAATESQISQLQEQLDSQAANLSTEIAAIRAEAQAREQKLQALSAATENELKEHQNSLTDQVTRIQS
jgi:chromosome segregation ATPase|eukprot:SAG25_NODE_2073_length_1983_cov_1.434183_2_plen_116_part_00